MEGGVVLCGGSGPEHILGILCARQEHTLDGTPVSTLIRVSKVFYSYIDYQVNKTHLLLFLQQDSGFFEPWDQLVNHPTCPLVLSRIIAQFTTEVNSSSKMADCIDGP